MAETPAANNMQAENVAAPAAEIAPAAATATMTPSSSNASLEALQRQMASAAQTAEKVFRSEFLANHFNDASQNALQFQQAADQAGNVTYSVTPSNPAMPMNEVAASINNVFAGMQDIAGSFSVVPPAQGQTAFQVTFPAGVTADKLYESVINAAIAEQQALQMAATVPAEQTAPAMQTEPAAQAAMVPAEGRPIMVAGNTAEAAPAMQASAQQADAAATTAIPAMQQPAAQPMAGNMPAGKQWAEKISADRAMVAENVATKA